MATLTVRRLDDDAYGRLRQRARANNRSLEAEARDILESKARDFDGFIADLKAFHVEMADRYGMQADSTQIIRELRDE